MLALYIFGGEVIRNFTFAMLFGIVIGTYSSIFIAAPLLLLPRRQARMGGHGGSKAKPATGQAATARRAARGRGAANDAPARPATRGARRSMPTATAASASPSMSHRGSMLCLPSGIYAWDVDDHRRRDG